MAQGFTYCWSDNRDAKVYVGIHLGLPDDGYVCSSKAMLAQQKERPQDFTREILFSGPYEMCAKFERSLISGLFKQDKATFYNRSNGKKILLDEEIKNKMSVKATGRKLSDETKKKISLAKLGSVSPRKGVTLSSQTRQKISESKKGCDGYRGGRTHSEETKLKMSQSHKNLAPFTEDHKENLSAAAKADWVKRKAGK
jgi:hypothetical protein